MTITTPNLKDVNLFKLDDFEYQQVDRMMTHLSKESALQVIINNTEGDFSQLSPELYQYAIKDKSFN